MDNEKDLKKKKPKSEDGRMGYTPRKKLLVLKDILYENTDEKHGITMKEILTKLREVCHVTPNVKTVYTDIDVLEDYGIEVLRPHGQETEYRLIKRKNELNYVELKMLIDTIQASHFLTKKQANTIISKLELLCSVHERKTLNHEVIVANRAKSENVHVLYTMDKIHTAIETKKQIRFQYYEYNMYKKKEYHNYGEEYRVSPIALIYHQGIYMLVAIPARDDEIQLYRVDRMENAIVSRADRLYEEDFSEIDIERYTAALFGMHVSEVKDVTLRCHKSVVDAIMDRFGMEIPWTIIDEDSFELTVPIVLNANFFGWLLSMEGLVRIVSPEQLTHRFSMLCSDALRAYFNRWEMSKYYWHLTHDKLE